MCLKNPSNTKAMLIDILNNLIGMYGRCGCRCSIIIQHAIYDGTDFGVWISHYIAEGLGRFIKNAVTCGFIRDMGLYSKPFTMNIHANQHGNYKIQNLKVPKPNQCQCRCRTYTCDPQPTPNKIAPIMSFYLFADLKANQFFHLTKFLCVWWRAETAEMRSQ